MSAQESNQKQAGVLETQVEVDEFSSLLKQSFKPKTERAATEVDNAITTLVKTALADSDVIQDDVLDTIGEMIRRLDEQLSAQLNRGHLHFSRKFHRQRVVTKAGLDAHLSFGNYPERTTPKPDFDPEIAGPMRLNFVSKD